MLMVIATQHVSMADLYRELEAIKTSTPATDKTVYLPYIPMAGLLSCSLSEHEDAMSTVM